MADLFDGLDRLSDDDLRRQIAMLRKVTLYNAAMETGTRAVNRLISSAGNFLSALRGEENVDESELINVKIRKMHDLIEEAVRELSAEGRRGLLHIMRSELALKAAGNSEMDTLPDDEKIWCQVVRMAAGAYGLNLRQPVSLLADGVAEQYKKHMLRVLHSRLVKEKEEERKLTDGACALALRVTDIEQIRELNRELQLPWFNPRSIMEAVRADQTARTLEKLTTVIGFDAFDPEKCVIQTVGDAIKTLIIPERILFASLIWTCQRVLGKKYSISKDLLPSFVNDGRSNGVNEVDVRFMEMLRKTGELENGMNSILSEIAKVHTRQVECENDYRQVIKERELAVAEKRDMEKLSLEAGEAGKQAKRNLDEYESRHPVKDGGDVEYRQRKSQYEQAAAGIRSARYKVERAQKQLERLEKRIGEIRRRASDYDRQAMLLGNRLFENSQEYNQIVFMVDNEALYRSIHLQAQWEKMFSELSFDKNVFENMVKSFSTIQINNLEMAMWELNSAKNPESYAHEHSRNEGEEAVEYCLVAAGKYARICYKDRTIRNITIKER